MVRHAELDTVGAEHWVTVEHCLTAHRWSINILFYNDLDIAQLRENDIILKDLFDKEDSDSENSKDFKICKYNIHRT